MKILGIKYGGHDTSAALMIDGKLVAACAQERYTKDKHSRRFPLEAINDCLKIGKINLSDIDEIAYVNDIKTFLKEIYLKPAIKNFSRLKFLIKDFRKFLRLLNTEKIVRRELEYKGKIKFYRHHLCHIASAYYPSGFEKALCLSLDGMAENETGMIAEANSGKINILNAKNLYPDSLGLFYSAITDFLGWKHHCDEGIIMGLAPYGNPHEIISNTNKSYKEVFDEILIEKNEFEFKINLDFIDYYTTRNKWVTEKFKKIFGEKRKYSDPLTDHHKNIAAALQLKLENLVINKLKAAKEKYGYKKLCLSGGVALNCSMNGKIEQSRIFDEIYVQPASADDGCAIGACYLANFRNNKKKFFSKSNYNSYLGSRYSDDEIEIELKNLKLDYSKSLNIFRETAEELSKGKIIGWFQGAAEFGPRALGNRSILCKPYPAEMKDYLNNQVKFRESFRPFAPAILSEYQRDFFEINQDSFHMLIASKVKEDKKGTIPAVVHVDRSARVQTVNENSNKKFYNLLKEFNNLTNIPVLLNTSFNVKGQPIVNNPRDAIETFKKTKIDVLSIGNFLLKKKN